eukprot:6318946-Amphidinium_carterae.2
MPFNSSHSMYSLILSQADAAMCTQHYADPSICTRRNSTQKVSSEIRQIIQSVIRMAIGVCTRSIREESDQRVRSVRRHNIRHASAFASSI